MRNIKSEAEVKILQKAADITVKVFNLVVKYVKPGITERDISKKITTLFIENGAEKNSFDPIVASGTNGAYPHHRDSLRKIKNGEFITLDFGCVYHGYCSDMTRTILVGPKPIGKNNLKVAEYYIIVKEAQEKAIKEAKPGMTGKQVDAIARDHIKSKGYTFGHSTGHGLGIDVHEYPLASPSYDIPLEEGCCITIEPGIYVEGVGGVRIEDDIILKKTGNIVLTKKAKK